MRRDNDHTLSLVRPHLHPGDRVLDVGCGWGYIAADLDRTHPGSWGIDIVDSRRTSLANFALYRGTTIDLPDDTFDVGILAFVLHHVPNADKPLLVREVARICRRTVVIVEDTPRNGVDRWLNRRHGETFRRSIGSTADFGFYSHAEWLQFFAAEQMPVVENRPLGRFCRDWKQPYARSVFAVSTDQRLAHVPDMSTARPSSRTSTETDSSAI